ncbi:D-galactonate transporter [Cupriavidus sp. OV038]|jgi:D-galactonate transporter|uniref:MFS transporter n=1 Tax=unclassified Cupriavidus TaxID=2640874 RepID=UPI0008EC751E|nr:MULTISPECIES: MFS transporter [unclassified Cupriavidus]SFB91619.1 D-galactonate transporter [Cupriavidus sp. OV038]SFO98729.1 D-galactonate transporter [Cupriavidus sp. OV096]
MSSVMTGAPGALESLPPAELAQQRNEAYRKITVRLIPFLVFLFILAWIDRVNVGFAKLQMLQDLQFSEAVYGLGAGIFFIGYFLFEVPSNLLLEKIGARKTLARITILWGLASMAMIFVKTPGQFYALRFLLGIFEAGFFPGVVLYLTYWFPADRRARINGLFMTSFAIAGVIGGPLAGFIMSAMDGVDGLANWQWLFVIEGIPSVLAGVAVLMFLPEKPVNAKWLTATEQTLVTREVEAEARDPAKHSSLRDAFANSRVWICAAIYFCVVSGNATIAFWSPSIIKELGVKGNLQIGLISAIPFVAGTIAMVLNGIHSDRSGERRMHCAMATLLAAVGLTLTGMWLHSATLALVALTIASVGILAAFPVFWSLPSAFLAGTAAAGGIALINSIGNLAGFVAPYMIGWFKTNTGRLSSGLYFVAALEACATVLVLAFIRTRR